MDSVQYLKRNQDLIYKRISNLGWWLDVHQKKFPYDLRFRIGDVAALDYLLRTEYTPSYEKNMYLREMYLTLFRVLILEVYEISRIIKEAFPTNENIRKEYRFIKDARVPIAKYQMSNTKKATELNSIPRPTTEGTLLIKGKNGVNSSYSPKDIMDSFARLLEEANHQILAL